MMSILAHMDEFDIAQQIRLERQMHEGAFVLVEGVTDIRRLERFLNENECAPVNCFGKHNLVAVLSILGEEGFSGCVGIADADFDRVTGSLVEHNDLIYSVGHDLDLDWVTEETLDRYLNEVGNPTACSAMGGSNGIRSWVMQTLRPLSLLRLLNSSLNLKYSLTDIPLSGVMVGDEINLDALVAAVSTGPRFSNPASKRLLKERLSQALHTRDDDLDQLTSGHDFCELLGMALRTKLGRREGPQTWRSEVEIHFRLAFSEDDFRAAYLYGELLEWQGDNPPYVVLRSDLH